MTLLPSNIQDDNINALFVTANVGSLFEDPSHLMKSWLATFLMKIDEVKPQFLALHMQEVGGKTLRKCLTTVNDFIRILCDAEEMKVFKYVRIYIDEDFQNDENFTALGNLYFIHENIQSVRIWNFHTHVWEWTEDKIIFCGNIEAISIKDKAKFPRHFFPENKWSRKGFMRTRWEINKTVFDLVNIHLFHDASNLVAASEQYPSDYSKTRRRVLLHTLQRFLLDNDNAVAPFFLFGDFNFRCDTKGVIKMLTEHLTVHRIYTSSKNEAIFQYRNAKGIAELTVGKKEFKHIEHQLLFKNLWLKKFDCELGYFKDMLLEFDIKFPPSYPYEENPKMPTDFMLTRCPAWCDRILMSPLARHLINDQLSSNIYNTIGDAVCMGDHKPIYLNICIKANQDLTKQISDVLHSDIFTKIINQDENISSWREGKRNNNEVDEMHYVRIRTFKEVDQVHGIDMLLKDNAGIVISKETSI